MSFSLDLFIALLAGSITTFLGVVVYMHDRKSATNFIFGLLALVFAVWSGVNYFSVVTQNNTALFWIRGVLVAAVPQVFLLLLFVQNFPSEKLVIKRRTLKLVMALMAMTMLLAVSPAVFEDVRMDNGTIVPVVGPLVPVFALIVASFSFITFFLIVKKYRISEPLVRKQWRSISIGLVTTFALLIFLVLFQVVIFENTTFVRFAPLFIVPIFLGSAYAILRHKLFNIKVVTTEIFTFLLMFISLIQVLISTSTLTLVLSIAVTLFSLFFSVLLVRSVLKEVKQREQLQELTDELQKVNEQLQALDKARAEFISIASHQLRTPPATIKWYVGAILSGDFGALTPDLKAALDRINVTNNSQISLIDDLLNASRIERGKLEFFFELGNLAEMTELTVEQLKPQAGMKKLTLTYHEPVSPLPQVMLDKEKVRQVINNFIDNAIKYTKQGSIDVSLEQTATDVLLKVKDSGRGVPSDVASTLFEKYKRGKDSATTATGLGLGLYVAKVIIEQNMGKIWVESDGEEKGATFIFSIPIHSTLKETSVVDLVESQRK